MFKKSFLVVLLMALVFNTVGLYATDQSSLDSKIELNQSNVVDKITIEPNELRHGELTKITVDFSEKVGMKLTSNNKITMDAPQDLDIFEISESDPSELVYQGIVIGHFYTINNRKQFVVVFNENVDQAYNHKGSFYLTAKAQYVGETPKPNETYTNNFDTTLGTDAPSADYSISYSRTEGSSPFFYKPNGAIWTTDPNHVNWWLHINRNQDPFPSDIEITDTIKPGQVFELLDTTQGVSVANLNKEYFKITIASGENSQSVSPIEFVELGYGTFEFLSEDTFVIKILKEAMLPSNEITIQYQTKITPEGKYQQYFYNDASAKYIENGQEVIKESLDKVAENISSGGIIAPELGTLRIVKLAKDGDLTETLGSATFKLFQEDGSEIILGTNNGIFETGNNGQVTTPPLTPGKYYITELSAPNFVDFDPSIKYPFEIKLDSEVGVQLVISNEVKRTSIDVEKIWNDKFETHPNVTIKLLADGIEVDQVELSDDKLTHTFGDLAQYTVSGNLINYTVKELELEGFESNITGDMETGFTVTNTVIKPDGVLEAHKLVSKPEVRQEEVFEYTIIVNNSVEGSKTFNNVNVKDTLPSGISFVDSKIYVNGSLSEAIVTGNSFEVELESVSYNDNHKITFLAKADRGVSGNRINTAIVTNPEDPDKPLEPTVPVTVIPTGELAAVKKVSQGIVKPEETFMYTIEVSNVVEGSDPLFDVLVKDTLPEGIVFANDRILINGSVANNAVISGTTFNVTLDEVEYGKPVVITFTAKAEQGVFGELINKAHVTDPNDPDNPKEPEVPVVVVPDGEIEAQKMVSKDEVKPNEVFTYTIKVSNLTEGSDSIKNVEVSDVLPEGLVFHDQIIKVNGKAVSAQITEDNFKVILDELKYGEDVEITFDVKAEQGTFGELINKALIVDPEDPDNPKEPEVQVVVIPNGAIKATKLVSKDIVKPEEEFTYTIIVENTKEGSKGIKNVRVEDVLPEGLEFVNHDVLVTGGEANVEIVDNKLEAVLSEVSFRSEISLTFNVKAQSSTYGTKINRALVTNPEDPENPEEPEVPVTVIPDGKLVASKLVSKDEVKPEEEFTYTIIVKNTVKGSNDFKDVRVTDTLPKGIVFVDDVIYVNDVENQNIISGNSFEVILSELKYGEDVSISFKVMAEASEVGIKVNKAIVVDPEDPDNPVEPEVPVTVVPTGQMSVEKLVSKAEVKPEEVFTYTIKVSNIVQGSNPIKGVSVEDTLPEGLVFTDSKVYVNGVLANATINSNSFSLTLNELRFGEDVEVTFEVKALEGEFGEKVNVATVTNPEDPENPEEPEVPVTVAPDGQLSAEKEVSKSIVKPMETFEYTIIVKNTKEGSKHLSNVLVEDTLPEGLEFASEDVYVDGKLDAQAVIQSNKLSVVLSKVSYGEDVKVVFTVRALEGEFGEKINIAKVTNPEDPENPEEPEVPVDVVPDGAISAEKLVSKDEVKPEEVFTYTIKVSNTVEGSKALKNVTVEDVLPKGLVFTDSKVYVNGVLSDATVTGQSFKLVLVTLEYGQDVEVSFDVKAWEGEFGEKINVATVANPEDPENPEEPEVPVDVVPDGKLHSEKLASVKEVKVNDYFEYTINVSNTVEGSNPLRNIVVKDTLPQGLEFADSIIYVNGIAVDGEVKNNGFEIVLDEVHYGKDISIAFSVHVLYDATGTIVNVATVIDPENPEEPQEPKVPVTVVPDPVDPEPTPSEPKTPSTGIGSVTYYVELLFVSIISLLALLVLKRKEKQKI